MRQPKHDQGTIIEPARRVPVVHECDICVVGGSATGVFAAVRAARLGARVAIVERQNCFGGVATAAMVNIWHSLHDTIGEQQIIAGLTEEVIERLVKRDAVLKTGQLVNAFRMNTEELKIELDELVVEHGITAFLHTLYCAPVLEDGRLKAIVVENKNGRQAIVARQFIDASGDGNLAMDLELEAYDPGTLQPPTTCAKIQGLNSLGSWDWQGAVIEHGHEFGLREDWGWGGSIPGLDDIQMRADTHVFDTNTAEADSLTASEIEGRRQVRAIMDVIRKYGPADSRIGLVDLAATIGARETRRIAAGYRMTGEDVLYGHRFDDAIAYGSYRVDIHHAAGAGITFRYLDGSEVEIPSRGATAITRRWRQPQDVDPTYYQIPFRSLVQDRIPNLTLAGRMLDADKTAFSAVRVMVNMNQTGEAAGTAAYLALDSGEAIWQIDPAAVRRTLAAGGSVML